MDELSYDQYREVMNSLNSLLSEFVSVENSIMSCGLTKAFDFNASTSALVEIDLAVKEIHRLISAFSNQQNGNYSINTAITYIDLLIASIEQLALISENLANKAKGMKYGFFAYRKDIKDYKKKENSRAAMGDQLNSAFSRSW